MTTHTTPVNKQAAIFLSRKPRVETVRQALDIFAKQLLAPEVEQNIIEMMKASKDGVAPCLKIIVKIHRDNHSDNGFAAKLQTFKEEMLGEEHYFALH